MGIDYTTGTLECEEQSIYQQSRSTGCHPWRFGVPERHIHSPWMGRATPLRLVTPGIIIYIPPRMVSKYARLVYILWVPTVPLRFHVAVFFMAPPSPVPSVDTPNRRGICAFDLGSHQRYWGVMSPQPCLRVGHSLPYLTHPTSCCNAPRTSLAGCAGEWRPHGPEVGHQV